MNRVLIAGLGNETRGDDMAGLLAARALRELGLVDVDIQEFADSGSLAAAMVTHSHVVVIDAVEGGGEAGQVVELTPTDSRLQGETSSHGLGLGHAVALARALGASPAVVVLGITGRDFGVGSSPSPGVVLAASEVAARIGESLRCA